MINLFVHFLFSVPSDIIFVPIGLLLLLIIVALYFLRDLIRRHAVFGKILKEFIVVLLVWGIIAFLLVPYGSAPPLLILFWICLLPFGYIFNLVNLYWLIPAFERKKKWIVTYVVELMAAAVIAAFPFFMIGASLHHQFSLLILSFVITMMISLAVTWFIYLRNKEHIQQLLYLKKELERSASSLEFLRAQINPHFLFNILNTLYGMAIRENAMTTGDGIQKLGDMMRFMLQDNQKDMISLASEIKYLKDYIFLQQLRLAGSENMQMKVNIIEPSHEYLIAPMILIPFVENAFKHGVSLQRESWITIELNYHHQCLEYEVRNSLHHQITHETEVKQAGIGLENVKERLKLLYPDKHQLTIKSDEKEFMIHLTLYF